MKGKIIKGVGGVYQVWAEDGILYTCAAKGIFRHQKVKPLIGDDVEIQVLSEVTQENQANIVKLLERQNELLRPTVANVDQAVLIMACKNPEPNLNLLDRFLLLLQQQQIPVIICWNKADLVSEEMAEHYCRIYRNSGCTVTVISTRTLEGVEQMQQYLEGKTTVLAGPSGVGKSSFLNAVCPAMECKTGELSEKIGRGKHTTRHSELLKIAENTYVCDTPGFSSIFLKQLLPEELRQYYPEFYEWEKECRFLGCMHYGEKECGVKDAVEKGYIPRERYENYRLIYEEVKAQKRY